ncbi:hypothetical protein [Mycobacteroides abscessus]|uniref:hypothetical protein n=1 Tax=Mycobacteroides abscessus TaxID=36809 RepID=UPI000C267F04|nr:hypothetical protein [Mycobacteroides abscessus]
MSTRKLVRGIGEKTEVIKVNYNAEIVEDEENLYLVCAGSDIAWASEEVGGSRYVVSVFAGGSDFFVPNEIEAIDALHDIGLFYLAVKAGEV